MITTIEIRDQIISTTLAKYPKLIQCFCHGYYSTGKLEACRSTTKAGRAARNPRAQQEGVSAFGQLDPRASTNAHKWDDLHFFRGWFWTIEWAFSVPRRNKLPFTRSHTPIHVSLSCSNGYYPYALVFPGHVQRAMITTTSIVPLTSTPTLTPIHFPQD